jgi:AraC-like DNA-binding protein
VHAGIVLHDVPRNPVAMNKGRAKPIIYFPRPFGAAFPFAIDVHHRHRMHETQFGTMHLHDFFEIGYCHQGKGVFRIGAKLLPFVAGDLCLINHREPHVAYYYTDCVWSWIYLDPVQLLGSTVTAIASLDTSQFSGPSFANILPAASHEPLSTMALQMIEEFERKEAGYREAISGLALAFMVRLQRVARISTGSGPPQQQRTGADVVRRIGPAIDHIHRHYAEPLTVETLARLASMSPTHFRRVFRSAIGASPHEYVTGQRIASACRLLRTTDKNVETVAFEVGFDDPSAFHRAFRKTTGQSPGAWRTAIATEPREPDSTREQPT